MIPQIILISLYAISLLLAANQHGKPKTGTNNFWYPLVSTLIVMACLYYSGFFNVFTNN